MSSILKVDQLQDSGGNAIITSDGAGNITPGSLNIANAQIASNAAIATSKLGTGAVLQTKYYQLSTAITSSSQTWTDLGSFSVSITPSSTSNFILLSANFGSCIGSSSNNTTAFRFTRNGTPVAYGDQVGSSRDRASFRTSSIGKLMNGDSNHAISVSFDAIDAPSSTSALTYKIQHENENGTVYINRSVAYADIASIHDATFFSSFIVQEIAG